MLTFAKSGYLQLLLVAFVIFVTLIPHSDAVKCYNCPSNSNCATLEDVECEEGYVCMKMDGFTEDSRPIKTKSCAEDTYGNRCRHVEEGGHKNTYCYCNTDFCNADTPGRSGSDGGSSAGTPSPPHRQSLCISSWLIIFATCVGVKQLGHLLG